MIKQSILLIILIGLSACQSEQKDVNVSHEEHESIVISDPSYKGECPYLTTDHKGNPVLSWVEEESENAVFLYAVSLDDGISFEKPIKVSVTKGLAAHHESMPKIAFKANGDTYILYQIKKPSISNRFASALYYTESNNEGKSWSTPRFLHSDTTEGVGRSFFDVSRLPDGELGAIWLDGRKRLRNGSTLMFAKTNGNQGFQKDIEIGQKTCQCCRTDIYVDANNTINIAYRDIINDSIRDIVHLTSKDFGKTFSESTLISEDNWVIDGCPHTGPTMASTETELHFFWFTLGGGDGIFQASSLENGATFTKRKLFSPHGRHPQIVSNKTGEIAVVWDEIFKTDSNYVNRIGLMFQNENGTGEKRFISSESVDASYPVILSVNNDKTLVAWFEKDDEDYRVVYSLITDF